MIENRGPQFVQLVAWYLYRKFCVLNISARHSAQVAKSGVTVMSKSLLREGIIWKFSAVIGSQSQTSIEATLAIGGAEVLSASMKSLNNAPVAFIDTPRLSLQTLPNILKRSARRQTKGR